MKQKDLLLLLSLLFVLVACSSATSTLPTSSPTPRPTPTQAVTPSPTIPDVPSRSVHFLTADHVQLAGLLYGQGKSVVICSHELHTNKGIWEGTGIPQRLASRGYLVLAYDFRGNGESSGEQDLRMMPVDLRAAITFAQQQGATRIVLLGSSMGGTATLKVAASVQVAAVITLSAPQDLIFTITDSDARAISAPKLFVNSQDDTYASDTNHMYSVANPPKELQLYPGSAHGVAIFDGDYGSDLTQRILNFIARYAPAS